MQPTKGVQGIVDKISEGIISPFITLLFAVATLVFMWGVIQMVISPEDTEARENGKQHIVWGILGATIMLGAYGIIGLISTLWE